MHTKNMVSAALMIGIYAVNGMLVLLLSYLSVIFLKRKYYRFGKRLYVCRDWKDVKKGSKFHFRKRTVDDVGNVYILTKFQVESNWVGKFLELIGMHGYSVAIGNMGDDVKDISSLKYGDLFLKNE